MRNEERLYLNKEVAEIVGITKRQVLSWTEKGLAVPAKESPGAGTKRGYDYINLLEFGLCKTLFKIGLGFRAVKKLLGDLRIDGTIKDWANNWKDYYKQLVESQKKHWAETLENESIPENVQTMARSSIAFLEKHEPQKPEGVIVYFAGNTNRVWVIPWEAGSVLSLNALKEGFSESDNCLLIDLGKIKANIDEKL